MNRQEGVRLLKDYFFKQAGILAVWESGSQATHRLDDYSDLDCLIICQDGQVETILKQTQLFLMSIIQDYTFRRAPEPTWHGFSQFFLLPNQSPYFYFDLSFTSINNPNKFTDVERHGTPVIWFERVSVYQPTHFDRDAINGLAKKTLASSSFYEPIIQREILKACSRDLYLDATSNYMTYIQRFLVPLINLKHRPHKADFGVRYLYHDLRPTDYQTIVSLFSVSSIESIQRLLPLASAMFVELFNELSAVYGVETNVEAE